MGSYSACARRCEVFSCPGRRYPTNSIDVVGDVHVGSVAEFFSALDQLYARLAEMSDGDRLGLDLNVNADIEGTPFTWTACNRPAASNWSDSR